MKRPSPCEVWRVISKERERERDFDIIQTLHLALACPVISVFELGLGSPYTSNRLSSVMKICYVTLFVFVIARPWHNWQILNMGFWRKLSELRQSMQTLSLWLIHSVLMVSEWEQEVWKAAAET